VAPHTIAVAGEALTATNLWREDRVAFTLSITTSLPWPEPAGAMAAAEGYRISIRHRFLYYRYYIDICAYID
jgi:hypothetical protein